MDIVGPEHIPGSGIYCGRTNSTMYILPMRTTYTNCSVRKKEKKVVCSDNDVGVKKKKRRRRNRETSELSLLRTRRAGSIPEVRKLELARAAKNFHAKLYYHYVIRFYVYL